MHHWPYTILADKRLGLTNCQAQQQHTHKVGTFQNQGDDQTATASNQVLPPTKTNSKYDHVWYESSSRIGKNSLAKSWSNNPLQGPHIKTGKWMPCNQGPVACNTSRMQSNGQLPLLHCTSAGDCYRQCMLQGPVGCNIN